MQIIFNELIKFSITFFDLQKNYKSPQDKQKQNLIKHVEMDRSLLDHVFYRNKFNFFFFYLQINIL